MRLSVLVMFVVLAGCASKPDDIATQYVSTLGYEEYNCKQIRGEAERLSRRVAELQGTLQKDATADAVQMGVGLVLFWPTLFLLEGGDGPAAHEYGRLKGEKAAIEKVSVKKDCGVVFENIKG